MLKKFNLLRRTKSFSGRTFVDVFPRSLNQDVLKQFLRINWDFGELRGVLELEKNFEKKLVGAVRVMRHKNLKNRLWLLKTKEKCS